MVIAGIGENKVNHAKKIANTALGMLLLSKEVVSPLDEEPVQVWGSESKHPKFSKATTFIYWLNGISLYLTLKAPKLQQTIFYFYLLEKIRLDFSCDSSA